MQNLADVQGVLKVYKIYLIDEKTECLVVNFDDRFEVHHLDVTV